MRGLKIDRPSFPPRSFLQFSLNVAPNTDRKGRGWINPSATTHGHFKCDDLKITFKLTTKNSEACQNSTEIHCNLHKNESAPLLLKSCRTSEIHFRTARTLFGKVFSWVCRIDRVVVLWCDDDCVDVLMCWWLCWWLCWCADITSQIECMLFSRAAKFFGIATKITVFCSAAFRNLPTEATQINF
jgi:hypothetical protein